MLQPVVRNLERAHAGPEMLGQGEEALPIAEIDWIEAEANYVRIHLGKESHLLRQPISRLERELDPRRFMRVHRSFIVNVTRVIEVQPWFGGDWIVLLRDGSQLRMSRNYRDAFYERLTGVRGGASADAPDE